MSISTLCSVSEIHHQCNNNHYMTLNLHLFHDNRLFFPIWLRHEIACVNLNIWSVGSRINYIQNQQQQQRGTHFISSVCKTVCAPLITDQYAQQIVCAHIRRRCRLSTPAWPVCLCQVIPATLSTCCYRGTLFVSSWWNKAWNTETAAKFWLKGETDIFDMRKQQQWSYSGNIMSYIKLDFP